MFSFFAIIIVLGLAYYFRDWLGEKAKGVWASVNNYTNPK